MNRGAGHAAILIAGPTASGKSALAGRLAQRLNGIVVNADSMQVYRDLRILTARPSEAEEAAAPHALYGTIDGAENHSVSKWLTDAAASLMQARAASRIPIFVGGTGLYFKALTQGLSDIPPVPDAVRAEVRAWAASRPPADLHLELSRRDPATAVRLRPTDPQRLIRALEVHAATGQSLSAFQDQRTTPVLDADACLALKLSTDRTELYARVERRFDQMMREGAMEEVKALAERALDPALPLMRAHGVPPLLQHLRGDLTLAETIARGKLDTRHYVRRQETFFRHQLPTFHAVAVDDAEALVMRQFV